MKRLWILNTGFRTEPSEEKLASLTSVLEQGDEVNLSPSVMMPSPSPKKQSFSSSLGLLDASQMSLYSFGSLEGKGGDVSTLDTAELLTEISELQFQNKKVVDQNTALQAQLANAEDASTLLQAEFKDLSRKLNNAQMSLEKTHEFEDECEELRLSLAAAEEKCTQFKKQLQQLEKENSVLLTEIKQIKEEIDHAYAENECLHQRETELRSVVATHKAEIEALKEHVRSQVSTCQEQVAKRCAIETMLEDYSSSTNCMRQEKAELEMKLTQVQEELFVAQEKIMTLASCPGSLVDASADLQENMKGFQKYSVPSAFSTPFRTYLPQSSIHAEIRDLGIISESFASPFCGKGEVPLDLSIVPYLPPRELEPSQMASHLLQQKKMLIKMLIQSRENLKTEGEIMNMQKLSEPKFGSESDWESKHKKVNEEKETSEEDSDSFRETMKEIIEENKNLDAECKAVLHNLGSRILTVQSEVNDENKELEINHTQLKALQQEVEEQQSKIKNLQEQLAFSESELVSFKQQPTTLNWFLVLLKQHIQTVTYKLASSTAVVAEKYRITEGKMTQISEEDLLREIGKDGGANLDGIDNMMKGAGDGWNQLGIVDLDTAEIETNCVESQEKAVFVTPEKAKVTITKELLALRIQIAKSQAILTALARGSILSGIAKTTTGDSSQPSTEKNQLADALNLELLGSGHSPLQVTRTSHRENALQMESRPAARTCLTLGPDAVSQHKLAKSCPTLSSQVTTGTQTDLSELAPARTVSADDVKEDSDLSPKRSRSSSFIAAIERGNPEHKENASMEMQELSDDDVFHSLSRSDVYEPGRINSMDLDEYRNGECSSPKTGSRRDGLKKQISDPDRQRKTGIHAVSRENRANDNGSLSRTIEGAQEDVHKMHPRFRRRSLPGSPGATIQRAPAVDYDEVEETPEEDVSDSIKQETKRRTAAAKETLQQLEAKSEAGRERSVSTPPLPSTDLKEHPSPPPPSKSLKSFPSLQDSFLMKLDVHRDSSNSNEALNEQDIEGKFTSLSLAFKTDKLTLTNRLQLQQRQRDLAEKNVEEEINQLKDTISSLNCICIDAETTELLVTFNRQMDVLRQSISRVSSTAEMYGAVQQENRVSKAIEVMLLHMENLKRLHEKDHHELSEAKRILVDNNLVDNVTDGTTEELQSHSPRHARAISSVISKFTKSGSRRRASIAALPRSVGTSPGDGQKSSSLSLTPPSIGEANSKFFNMVRLNQINPAATGGRRCSLSPSLRLSPSTSESPSPTSPEKLIRSFDSSFTSSSSPFSPMEEIEEEGKCKDTGENTVPVEENNNCKKEEITPEMNGEEKLENEDRSEDILDETSQLEQDHSQIFDEIDKLAAERDNRFNELGRKIPPLKHKRKRGLMSTFTLIYEEINWPWDWEQTKLGLRYCVTGMLLLAAFFSLFFTFIPTSAEEKHYKLFVWTTKDESIWNIVKPYLSLRHYAQPPT